MWQRFLGRQVILQHQTKATNFLFVPHSKLCWFILSQIDFHCLERTQLWVQSFQRKCVSLYYNHLVLVLLKLSKSLAQQGERNTSYNSYQGIVNYLLSLIYVKGLCSGKSKIAQECPLLPWGQVWKKNKCLVLKKTRSSRIELA